MDKFVLTITPIIFCGMFIWVIINDNRPIDDIELIMRIVISLLFIYISCLFAFFPEKADAMNKKSHMDTYRMTGFKLFKFLSEKVDSNPSNTIRVKIFAFSTGAVGLTLLVKSLVGLLL